jgi:hypothetical protein
VAVTIRQVAISSWVAFFMVFFLGLVRGVNGSGLLSGIGSGSFRQSQPAFPACALAAFPAPE